MAKVTIADEVAILRFFECGPLDKAETLFTIVADKMRERLRDRGGAGEAAISRRQNAKLWTPQPFQTRRCSVRCCVSHSRCYRPKR